MIPAEKAKEIASRLSAVDGIRVPNSFGPAPSAEQVLDHLLALLLRDPGLFCERYYERLTDSEAEHLQPLRQDIYEVDFYLRAREAGMETSTALSIGSPPGRGAGGAGGAGVRHQPMKRQGVNVIAKNRRLAFLRRLEAAGEYFSDVSMRDREPQLFQQYIGRFLDRDRQADPKGAEGGLAASLGAAGGGGGNMARLSEALLDRTDEAEWRRRVGDYDDSDSESEYDSGSDRGAAVAHADRSYDDEEPGLAMGMDGVAAAGLWGEAAAGAAPTSGAAAAAAAAAAASARSKAPAAKPASTQAPPPIAGLRLGNGSGSGGASKEGAAGPASGSKDSHCNPHPHPHSHHHGHHHGPAHGHQHRRAPVSPQERELLREEFRDLMRMRFLSGQDPSFNFAAIDGNTELDDDFLQERARDEEERYFDED